jgi:flavin reductase (DIM6/NTAB) family NADH-FMN oxidoreductase RutF
LNWQRLIGSPAFEKLILESGGFPRTHSVDQGLTHGGRHARGYRHEKNKFEISGLTPLPGETVAAPRAAECPVQIEAKVAHVHQMAQEDDVWRGNLVAIELRVTRVHAHPQIMMDGEPNRIDPDKWRPLIMSFQQFYGLSPQKLQRSELGQIPETAYKPPGWRPAA